MGFLSQWISLFRWKQTLRWVNNDCQSCSFVCIFLSLWFLALITGLNFCCFSHFHQLLQACTVPFSWAKPSLSLSLFISLSLSACRVFYFSGRDIYTCCFLGLLTLMPPCYNGRLFLCMLFLTLFCQLDVYEILLWGRKTDLSNLELNSSFIMYVRILRMIQSEARKITKYGCILGWWIL